MYDWQAKIGVIVPASNTVTELEFHRMAVEGVSIHVSRVLDTGKIVESAADMMEKNLKRAAEQIAKAGVDVIIYCCTAGSFMRGAGYDLKLSKDIEDWTGIPALTTSTAVVNALRSLKLTKIAIGTPYPPKINLIERKFFTNNGFKIVKMKGLGIADVHYVAKIPLEAAYALAKEIDRPDASGIFLSCTNFRTIEVIEKLEKELNKPVISSNQASFWAALKVSGLKMPIKNFGRLLAES